MQTTNIELPWPEPQKPKYRAGHYRDWRCEPTPYIAKPYPGYFRLHESQPAGWMFKKAGVVWMSLAAMERESHMPHIAAARGHVVVAGLGMGFVTFNLSRKPEVTKVTVLERDRAVIGLMDRVTNWRSWPKVELVVGDALAYRPVEPVDFLYADIWAKLGDKIGLGLTKTIQANVGADHVGMWGQEFEFLDWCRAKHIHASEVLDSDYRRFVADTGLPLIGAEWRGYARLATAATIMQILANPNIKNDRLDRGLLFNTYRGLVADRERAA